MSATLDEIIRQDGIRREGHEAARNARQNMADLIQAARDEGLTMAAISRETGITRERLYQFLAEARGE